jgi:hypothetical protein
MEANNITEKVTRGTVGLNALTDSGPMSRYASRSIVDSLAGPSIGLPVNIAKVIGAAATGDISESDVKALRQLFMYQNHFAGRYLFDRAEAGIADSLGVERKAQ